MDFAELQWVAWRRSLRAAEAGDVDAGRRLRGRLERYLKLAGGRRGPIPRRDTAVASGDVIAARRMLANLKRLLARLDTPRGPVPRSEAEQALQYTLPALASFLDQKKKDQKKTFAIIRDTARAFAMSPREIDRAREWYLQRFEDPRKSLSNLPTRNGK